MNPTIRVFTTCVLLVAACAGPSSPPVSDVAPTPTTAAPASEATPGPATTPVAPVVASSPRAGDSRQLQGVLRYTEIPQRKSVEAFRGEDLTLVADGESWNLGATAQVTDEQLMALAGKRIEVTATYVPPVAPDPMAQAPMGPDGKTMDYPARWDVTAVRVLGN